MKLILHIGTHKTATTSIQHFMAVNRPVLRRHGYLYPKNNDSAYVMNHLASQMVHNKQDKTRLFIKKSYDQAKKNNCHTLIISAESFYAMTGFFKVLVGQKMTDKTYWQEEDAFIKALASYCHMFESVEVVCVLRTQESYLTSLYNQFIKNTRGSCDDYETFSMRAKQVLNYQKHIALWTKYFGQESLSLCLFDDIKKDPVKNFFAQYLSEKLYEACKPIHFHSNQRLTRDILEFKRQKNALKYDRALAYVGLNCYQTLSKEFPDKNGWQIYAPLDTRKKFFSSYKSGNKDISDKLATMDEMSEPNYPGITDEKFIHIEQRYNEILAKPSNQISLAMRRSINFFIQRSTTFNKALTPIRSARNWLRLHIEGW